MDSNQQLRRYEEQIRQFGEPEPMDCEDFPEWWNRKYLPHITNQNPTAQLRRPSSANDYSVRAINQFGVYRTFPSQALQAVNPRKANDSDNQSNQSMKFAQSLVQTTGGQQPNQTADLSCQHSMASGQQSANQCPPELSPISTLRPIPKKW